MRNKLIDVRTGKPFRSAAEQPHIPGENLMLGVIFCILIVSVLLYILTL
jgi:hypothetical protein